MTAFKNALQSIAPLILGAYFLAQGGALLMNANPIAQLAGVGVLAWVPGCAYYAWRGRKALLRAIPTVQAMPERTEHQLIA